jgi:hypothetical protein
MVDDDKKSQASLKPFAVSVADTARILDCGESTVWEKLAKGELHARKDGVRTKILMASIERHVETWPRAKFEPLKPRQRAARVVRRSRQRDSLTP